MSNLEEIIEKWRREGLREVEIDNLLNALKRVYISQHIRGGGALESDFWGMRDYEFIKKLIEEELVRRDRWYSLNLIFTSDLGSRIAKDFLEKELDKFKKDIMNFLVKIPRNLLRFLLYEEFLDRLQFNVKELEYSRFFDWKYFLFKDSRIFIMRGKILRKLEECGLAVKTHYYVSTRGGERRELKYVISPEVQGMLKEIGEKLNLSPIDDKVKKMVVIYWFLVEKILPFVLPPEEKTEDVINGRRQEIWNRLLECNLREEDIKPVIDELAKNNITTEYRGFLVKDLPFEVKDQLAFEAKLNEMLLEPVLNYLLTGKTIDESKFEIKERPEVFKEPSDMVSEDEFLKFYNELGNFENSVREFIAKKLGKNLERANTKEGAIANIVKRLKTWRNFEKQFLGSDYPLIYYATFEDYIKLIEYHWELFNRFFKSREEVRITLQLINVLARRPLAHFRALTKEQIRRAREEMNNFMNRIKL